MHIFKLYMFFDPTNGIVRRIHSTLCKMIDSEKWEPKQKKIQYTSAECEGGRAARRSNSIFNEMKDLINAKIKSLCAAQYKRHTIHMCLNSEQWTYWRDRNSWGVKIFSSMKYSSISIYFSTASSELFALLVSPSHLFIFRLDLFTPQLLLFVSLFLLHSFSFPLSIRLSFVYHFEDIDII